MRVNGKAYGRRPRELEHASELPSSLSHRPMLPDVFRQMRSYWTDDTEDDRQDLR